MVLRLERQRLAEYVAAEKSRILPELRRLGARRHALADFVETAEALFAVLENNLEQRISLLVDKDWPVRP